MKLPNIHADSVCFGLNMFELLKPLTVISEKGINSDIPYPISKTCPGILSHLPVFSSKTITLSGLSLHT